MNASETRRDLWACGILFGSWLIMFIFVVATKFWIGSYYAMGTCEVLSPLALGSAYLLALSRNPLKYGVGLAGSVAWIFMNALFWGYRSQYTLTLESLSFQMQIPLRSGVLAPVFTVIGLIVVSYLINEDKKRMGIGIAVIVGVRLIYVARNIFLYQGIPDYGFQSAIIIIGAVWTLSIIIGGALILSVICYGGPVRLPLGTGAKVWCIICLVANSLAALVGLINRSMLTTNTSWITTILGVAGYALLISRRKTGYHIILLVTAMSFLDGFEQVVRDFSGAGVVSLFTVFINPLITGLVIRKAWKAAEIEGEASDNPLVAKLAQLHKGMPAGLLVSIMGQPVQVLPHTDPNCEAWVYRTEAGEYHAVVYQKQTVMDFLGLEIVQGVAGQKVNTK